MTGIESTRRHPAEDANPRWGRVTAFATAMLCVLVLPASAQPRRKATPPPAPLEQKADAPTKTPETPATTSKKGVKEQNFNFDGLGLNGRSRSPQLLYFLERANEELERASLEKRSFIPHMVKTLEEEQL